MYKELLEKIKEFDSIVIARHIGVDPDALCSQLALRDSIKLAYVGTTNVDQKIIYILIKKTYVQSLFTIDDNDMYDALVDIQLVKVDD